MSLLDELYEPCMYIDKARVPDGYGGTRTVWQDGAEFMAVITLDVSLAARQAQKEGVNNVYTITTRRGDTLVYGDVLRRLSDRKLFRVTSDGTDKKTPPSAGLDMRVVSAEELERLPD